MPSEKGSQRCSDRKITKPIMEKKRRARINRSLTELKTFLVTNYQQFNDKKKTKFEKADILEMTVKYLQSEVKSETIDCKDTASQDIELERRAMFEDGFAECTRNVVRFLNSCSGGAVGAETRSRLLRYLRQRWIQLGDSLCQPDEPMSPISCDDVQAVDLSLNSCNISLQKPCVVDDDDDEDHWQSRLSPISDVSDDGFSVSPPSPVNCVVSSTTPEQQSKPLQEQNRMNPVPNRTMKIDFVQQLRPASPETVWRPW